MELMYFDNEGNEKTAIVSEAAYENGGLSFSQIIDICEKINLPYDVLHITSTEGIERTYKKRDVRKLHIMYIKLIRWIIISAIFAAITGYIICLFTTYEPMWFIKVTIVAFIIDMFFAREKGLIARIYKQHKKLRGI